MSLKSAMRQTARRAPRLLGESTELVRRFVRSRQNPDGGFQDRAGQSDLYYTIFGLDALAALDETPDLAALENFLRSFGDGAQLDFVHLTCLARCWSELPAKKIPRAALLKRLMTFRARDGGFAPTPGAAHSTAYACLLAGEAFRALGIGPTESTQRRKGKHEGAEVAGAFGERALPVGISGRAASPKPPQLMEAASAFAPLPLALRLRVKLFPSLGKSSPPSFQGSEAGECGNQEIRKPEQSGTAIPAVKSDRSTTANLQSAIFNRQLLRFLEKFRSRDSAFANESGHEYGAVPATAAAVALLVEVGAPVPDKIAPWLLARCHARGGFCATPQTPLPDLLSTAVALHALATLGTPLDGIKEPCLTFIDSLWDSAGGFHGHWADDALDVEYTFYALLALGHLA
jgi:prenyltransferase beta subunit